MLKITLVLLTGILVSSITSAGQHEESHMLAPVASADQVVVVYEVPCKNVQAGMTTLKDLIAYEVGASPIAYSSSPGLIGDAAIGAVDLFSSASSMEKAVAWQDSDTQWKALQTKSLQACGINLDEIKATFIFAK